MTPRRERGAAAVEMAIVLPLLLLLIGGIIDFGRLMFAEVMVVNAAREGARMVAMGLPRAASARADAALTPQFEDVVNGGDAATITMNTTCTTGVVDASVTVSAGSFDWLLLDAFAPITSPPRVNRSHAMWRMTMRHLVRANRSERGAVATIVVVLLAFGVLLGFTAVAVDVGRTVVERRELQNGADAGALSLAQSCAKGNCVAGADGLSALVDSNAADGGHSIVEQCDSAGVIGPCSASSVADITQCPPVPAGFESVPYVEVRTQTSSGGGNTIANIFGGAAGGVGTSTVDTCARAGWGPIKGTATLPLSFRTCEFEEAKPVPPAHGVETALALKYDKDTSCDPSTTTPPGGDHDGGFGWLDNVDCVVTLDANNWAKTNPGVGKGNECYDELIPGTTVLVPIHDCISDSKTLCVVGSPSGSNSWYHIDGFAAFYVTAVDITGKVDALPGYPKKPAKDECAAESLGGGKSPGKCLYGWFLGDYVAASGTIDPGGTATGASVVQPLG